MAERINNLTKPGFPSLQFDVMNTLCFLLVLFTTQIIYTKEESSLDQNKTVSASSTTSGNAPPKTPNQGIDFDKVELFKDDDELPRDPQNLNPGSKRLEQPPINSTKIDLPKNGTSAATTKGNQTSRKIYEDYDTSDLQLDKYKIMVAPNKFKTVNAKMVRFLNGNQGSVNNSNGSQIGIKQFQNTPSIQILDLPNETKNSESKTANYLTKPASILGSIPTPNSNHSVTPIPWVIAPACLQKNESKYLFSAIFSKKPTVHLLADENGNAQGNQIPKIVINENSVTLSVGNATVTKDSYVKMNSSNTTKPDGLNKNPNPVVISNNDKTQVTNLTKEKPKIEDALLNGLTEFTMTIQNNTKPQDYIKLSKVGNSLTFSGQIETDGNDKKPKSPLVSEINTTAQQIQQQTAQLLPKLQANISVQTPTLTITAQGTKKKVESVPLLLLENNLLQTPLPGITSSNALTGPFGKPQQTINNILNSEIGGRSFFPPEESQNFKRPTGKETIGNLIRQEETSDVLYELFKNITTTNTINEDLNRKLLNESQIHTQQNWQLIKDNTDILNVLKNKNEQNVP